jgi:hypothetical protein
MGSSDPLPTGFEIQFGNLSFQATGNGYLMRVTNREELRARRQTGPAPAPVAPAAGGSTPASTDVAVPSAPRRCRRSGQHSRQARAERRQAARAASLRDALTGETTATPTGERSVSGPRFPIGLRGATMAYVASTSTDAATRRARPARHAPAVRNPSASADDESSHGSAWVRGVGLLRGAGPSDVSTVPRRCGLLVRLLRRLQRWVLRLSAGMLRCDRQRPSKRSEHGRSRRQRCSPRSGGRTAHGCETERASPLATEGADVNAQLAQAREL